mgnify:CR=1 FL=1
MKRLNKTILSLLFLGFSASFTAQQTELDHSNMREGEDVEYCVTHKKMMEMLKDPVKMKIWQAEQAAMEKSKEDGTLTVAPRGVVYKIPIVFHVLHNGGNENLSTAQIMDALDILNRDFRLQNTDANNVVSAFQGMPADSEIEFVLATKAPDGTCFSGITRTQSPLTVEGTSGGSGQVNAIANGNDVYNGTWRERDYLNIFICKEIGGAAGYTYNPFGGGTGMSGIWVLSNYVGSIGTSSVGTSRTLTHEVGHWLNLSHTWGGNNNPGNASSCSTDDGVSDTPNTIGVTACILGENSCGPLANVENYMDYSYCSKMYTQGQVDRMRNALNSSSGGRNNLWTTANLTARGATGNPDLCAAEFQADQQVICTGDLIEFTDESFHGVTGWDWTFTGGTPSTSTSQSPQVTYTSLGSFDVKLVVSDGVNSDTITKTNFVTVTIPGIGQALPFQEHFESGIFPPNGITINNPDGGIAWELDSNASVSPSHSISLDNLNSTNYGTIDEVILPFLDLSSNTSSPFMKFKWAYAKSVSIYTDEMIVQLSTDCGTTWSQIFYKNHANLVTGPTQTTPFIPDSSQWRDALINLSAYAAESYVLIKIMNVTDGGNFLYIDDIAIGDVDLSAEEIINENNFSIYPNPSNGIFAVSFETLTARNITLLVADGQIIRKITTSSQKIEFNQLAAGIYFVNVEENGVSLIKKVIIQ